MKDIRQTLLKRIPCPMCQHLISLDDDECPNCYTRFDDPLGSGLIPGIEKKSFLEKAISNIPLPSKKNNKGNKKKKKTKEKLVNFKEIEKNFRIISQTYAGVKPILLEDIIGSLSRYNDFNINFLPTEGFTTTRLGPVMKMVKNGVELPPIQVYEVNGKYFVIDGHHRISAYYLLGEHEYIDAEITQIRIEAPIEKNKNYEIESEQLHKFIIELERKTFQKRTYLFNNILAYPIIVTNVSAYGKLYEDIVNQHELEKKSSKNQQIIASSFEWYRFKFLPVIKLIHNSGMLTKFSNRTPSDLYVWLLMHRYFLSKATKNVIGFKKTIQDFINIKGKKAFFDNIPLRFDSYIKYILENQPK